MHKHNAVQTQGSSFFISCPFGWIFFGKNAGKMFALLVKTRTHTLEQNYKLVNFLSQIEVTVFHCKFRQFMAWISVWHLMFHLCTMFSLTLGRTITHLLIAALCSCRWATSCPFGDHLKIKISISYIYFVVYHNLPLSKPLKIQSIRTSGRMLHIWRYSAISSRQALPCFEFYD